MNDSLVLLLHAVDLCFAESIRIAGRGPRFRIVHRFRESGSGDDCFPGEEIAWVLLVHRGREFVLRLPLALLLMFDFLARYHRFPQSAAQIVSGLRSHAFYLRHGANARTNTRQTRKFSRSAIKEYVKRIRQALRKAFNEAGLMLDSSAVLVSEPTEGNQVGYKLRARVEWIHL